MSACRLSDYCTRRGGGAGECHDHADLRRGTPLRRWCVRGSWRRGILLSAETSSASMLTELNSSSIAGFRCTSSPRP